LDNKLLDVKNLETVFKQRKIIIHAVNGISFSIKKGEMLGVVGESGCGKSVSMLSIVNLIPPSGTIKNGQILFEGQDLRKINKHDFYSIRGNKIGIIFQDPITSLNPFLKIGIQISEGLIYHKKLSKNQAMKRSAELLDLVGIANPKERLNEYPHQFSGGMRQRVMIAIAISCEPELLIADEPTTALDVTIQAQIMELIKNLRSRLDTSIILITHDLALVAGMVDRVIVMYSGFIVEEALVNDLYDNPQHPYTISLLKSIPKLRGQTASKLLSIEGSPPELLEKPQFCPFAPRCKYNIEKCWQATPPMRSVSEDNDSHKVACWVNKKNGVEK